MSVGVFRAAMIAQPMTVFPAPGGGEFGVKDVS